MDDLVTSIDRSIPGEITIVAPNGRETRLLLNSNGYVREVRRIGGRNTIVGVREDGLLAAFTDPTGARTSFGYDSSGRLIRHVGPTGAVQTLNRRDLATGYEIEYTSGMGRRTKYTVRAAGDTTERLTQGPDGLVTSSLDSDSVTLTVTPDRTEYASVGAPDPLVGMFSAFASSSTTTTPSGRSLTTTETREIIPSGSTLATFTTLRSQSTVNSATWTTEYAKGTRTYTMTSPEGRVSTVKLDEKGRVIEMDDAGSYPVTITWGADAPDEGKVVSITQHDRSLTLDYDTARRLETLTDAIPNTVALGYDTADRVNKVTVPGSIEYSFGYDAADRLTSLTIPPIDGAKVHAFSYDPRGLETRYSPPPVSGNPPVDTERTWDGDRTVSEVRRPDGDRLVPTRDPAGRLIGLQTGLGDYRRAFSPTTGQLQSVTSPQGIKLSYTYDGVLPLTQQWSEGSTTIGWVGQDYREEDWSRNRVWMVGGGNNEQPDSIEYYYDQDGLLTGGSHENALLSIDRDAAGRVVRQDVPNLATLQVFSEAFGELTQLRSESPSQSIIFKTDYSGRDKLGRITSLKETNDTGGIMRRAFTYDSRGRLLTVTRSNADEGALTAEFTYAYDTNGNRTSYQVHGGSTTSATYDKQDRLLTTVTDAVTTAYAYTNAGMLSTRTTGSSITRYHHDAIGNLIRVNIPGSPAHVVEYEYDGQNRLVARKYDGSVTHRWLWDGQLRIIAELGPDRVRTKTFIYADGINSPEAMVVGGQVYSFAKDHLGSIRRIVSGSGDVVQKFDYGPWGERTFAGSNTDAFLVPFGFAGGQYDPATGLVRFGARDYDSTSGRWLSKDPFRLSGGFNLYEYAASSPISLFDPRGRAPKLAGDDPVYRQLKELADQIKKSGGDCKSCRDNIEAIKNYWKNQLDSGKIDKKRWSKIKGWSKIAKDGRLATFIFGYCVSTFDCYCSQNPEQCAAMFDESGGGCSVD